MTTKIGTPYYVSPEILEGQYDKNCDIWSIGVMTYVMLCGYPPFQAQNEQALFRKILTGVFTFEEQDWMNVSPEAKDFVSQCLQVQPSKRLDAEQALNHPWIQKCRSDSLQNKIHIDVLRRLKSFKKTTILQLEVLKVLSTLLASVETQAIKDTFYALDKSFNGSINYSEMQQAFYENKLFDESEDKELVLREIFFNVDSDNNEEITFSEFLIATLDPAQHLTRENLFNAFKYFDADGSNKITGKGLQKVFLRAGRFVSREELSKIMNQVQLQVTEYLTLERFLELFQVSGSNCKSPFCSSTASRSQRNSCSVEEQFEQLFQ